MKPVVFNLLSAVVLALCGSIVNAAQEPQPMAFSEIGAKASADYQGDAIGVTATPEGASLRTGFQKLSGRVTEEGLWLESTEGECDGLSLSAAAVGRKGSQLQPLPTKGVVALAEKRVTWARPGIVEEYSVSVDGVRQDFLLAEAPAGAGELSVELALNGARAEAQADGARLILAKSGRELAYSRLLVTDATGRELPARLEVLTPARLAVRVDDANASYPVRIDPTFSDSDWVSMNPGIPGTNGAVNASVVDSAGNLYIGGSFSAVGSVLASNVAKWNGSVWSTLGSGVGGTDDSVYALAVSGGDLYAGGWFKTAGGVTANHIAKWNGSVWSALGSGVSGYTGAVGALAVSGSDVYAGGDFYTAGGVAANRIAKWNGSAWSALGSGMNSSVNALAVSGSNLYAGGAFYTAGGVAANNIAKWNGSAWSALGSGVETTKSSPVLALAVGGGNLYAGGRFTSAGSQFSPYIAKAIIIARMQVEQPVGSVVPSGGTKSLGQVPQGGSSDMTFTIRNFGQSGLNLTGSPRVIVSGTDAAQFSVTAQPASPIATDGTTTFIVRFAPTSLGIKNAQISISSDAETPNYSLLLTGEGVMAPPPVISSAASAAAYVGRSFSYQITASNSPSSYGASGLPAGLGVETGSGLISGTPTAAGTFSITLTATNAGGTGTQTLTLTVNEVSGEAIGSWRQQHFGTAENSGNAADLAVPDGDGIPNLIKYALLMTPGQNGANRLPRGQIRDGRLAITFQRVPSRSDVSIIVEAQSGLEGRWTEVARSSSGGPFTGSAGVTETAAGSGNLNVTVLDIEASATRRFMRIRVER